LKCPECGSTELYEDPNNKEVTCRKCGLVLEEKSIEFGREWNEYNGEVSGVKRSNGTPITYANSDRGLTTNIGNIKDLANLKRKDAFKIKRLRMWQLRSSKAIEINLNIALLQLKRLTSFMNIPRSVEEEAAKLYTLAVRNNLVKGRNIEDVTSAALYLAIRLNNLPISLLEISQASQTPKKKLGKTYLYLCRRLDVKPGPPSTDNYIDKYVSQLGLSQQVSTRANEILMMSEREGLVTGKSPLGLTAACIYLATLQLGIRITQIGIADVIGVTEVTIRNRYMDIMDNVDLKKTEFFGEKQLNKIIR